MNEQAPDPHGQMMQMITGYWVTQLIRGAATVSLAERLADGPRSATEIAEAGVLHPDVAERFLRACASIGLVAGADGGRFAATPLLDTLRRDAPGSMHGMAMAQGAPGHWLPWGRFTDTLAAGRSQTIEVLGTDLFGYYAEHPKEAADFSRAMSGLTATAAREVVRVLDLASVSRAVDIGGAEGALLRALMTANPEMRGVVFDRPAVAAQAQTAMEAAGLADRSEIVGGDFFAEVPAGDLYLLKFILHDWDDTACLSILRNCRAALIPGGRIAIIEAMLGEPGLGDFASLLDANMMALAGGRERTFDEYKGLLEAAGFSGVKATPTPTPMVVIEAIGA